MKPDGSDIEVAIVEDDPEILKLFTIIISGSPGFNCNHTYNNCDAAIRKLPTCNPDVVLMDINLPGTSGIEGVKILKEQMPDTDFVMLTVQDDDDSIFSSLCAGATGYLLKDTPPAELLNSIKEVYMGGSPMSDSIARKIISSFQKSRNSPLSDRETEVLKCLCEGKNYKTISDLLFISGNTVRAHIKNIYKKLHVCTRAEAVNKAISKRLI